jgi:hypothetical protein
MVIRIILRNIQNTLVISSVLLVILALQRLQQYDTLYNNTTSSFLMSSSSVQQQQQQQQSISSDTINLSWDDHHPFRWDTKTLSFWWTIPFSITRFVRRSSKRILRMIMFQKDIYETNSPEDEEDNNNNNNKNYNNHENRNRHPRRKSSWEISDTTTSLAFVIDLTSLQTEMEEEGMSMTTSSSSSLSDCYWRMDVIQMISYTLLSPLNSKSSMLYVIVNDTMIPNNNSSNSNGYLWWWWCYGSLVGNITQLQQSSSSIIPHYPQQPSISFSHVQMIPSSSIGRTYSCPELWQSFAMHNLSHIDVAIRLPITAIGHKHSSRRRQLRLSSSSPLPSSLSLSSSSKSALNSFQYSSQQSILWMRPKVAVGHNHKCESTPVMSCPTPCRITQRLTIWVLPRKCAVPWDCSSTNETQSTPSSITPTNVPTMSLCHDYHTLWYQQRRELEQQQSTTSGNASNNKKVDICRDGKYEPLSSSLVYA